MSKGASVGTMLLRLGISAIPIPPIVTSLLSVAQQAVEKKVRSHLHQKSLTGATTEEEKVKFELKELSVEGLDRYRWKLREAMEQLNQKAVNIDAQYVTKQGEGKPCDAWLDLAEAIAQAERRYNRLSKSAGALKTAMDEALKWSNDQSTVINNFKKSVGLKFKDAIEAEEAEASRHEKTKPGGAEEFLNGRHVNCSSYCHWHEVAVGENAQWTAIKVKLALITKTIADPIGVEMFLATKADPYKMPEAATPAAASATP